MEKRKIVIKSSVDTILCDIEGTTTSISFVKDCLFPYVRANLKEYLLTNFDGAECREDIKLLIDQADEDVKSFGKDAVPAVTAGFDDKSTLVDQLVANCFWQMDQDRKAKALKQLQGHIWSSAYEQGLIKGHIYEDVVPAFERWKAQGYAIYIYSSGSIAAQKLLFGYSEKGDLLKYFSGHFDTTIGLKVEAQSYKNILESLGKTGQQVLFLTDMIREVEAALDAGIDVCLLRRPDNPDKEVRSYEWVENFNEIS